MNQLIGFNAKPKTVNKAGSAVAPSGGANASKGVDILDSSEKTFMKDVIEESKIRPVIVDFQAEWCGPCKQLGPILEKTVQAAKGAVRLVKIDIDQSPSLARQLQIQSIPMVYAFFQGQPVHGFQGAQPESKVKEFIQALLEMTGAGGVDAGLEAAMIEAQTLFDAEDFEQAGNICSHIMMQEPDFLPAKILLIEVLLAIQDFEQAQAMIDEASDDQKKSADIIRLIAKLALKQKAAEKGGAEANLLAAIEANPNDFASRFDLSELLAAKEDFEAAMDQCLEILSRNRMWEEEKARAQLLKYFEAAGMTNPTTISARRRLSSLLFQ